MDGDKIIMAGMTFYGKHGVLPKEKVLAQPFIIDAELWCDLSIAGASDDLNHTISYAEVFELVEDIVTNKHYDLIEALAEEIAGRILDKYDIKGIKIKVKKPKAPIKGVFDYMGCEIIRKKAGV